MVKCSKCGAEVVGSDFCFNCGEKVEKYEAGSDVCPKCGTKNGKNTTFCRECGHKLDNGVGFGSSHSQKEWPLLKTPMGNGAALTRLGNWLFRANGMTLLSMSGELQK
jgi:ribosomal protein L40E